MISFYLFFRGESGDIRLGQALSCMPTPPIPTSHNIVSLLIFSKISDYSLYLKLSLGTAGPIKGSLGRTGGIEEKAVKGLQHHEELPHGSPYSTFHPECLSWGSPTYVAAPLSFLEY